MQGGGTLGGRHITKLTVFKRKILWQSSKMYHMSANLAFGRREKIFGGTKSCRGKEAYKKNRKKSGDLFFFFFFLETVKNLWGRQKMSRGHQMATLRHWVYVRKKATYPSPLWNLWASANVTSATRRKKSFKSWNVINVKHVLLAMSIKYSWNCSIKT